MTEPDPYLIAWCAGSLALAGVVKGVVGIGIPMVSIALLSLAISVPQAVALLPVPILVANTWQAFRGGRFISSLQRFRPLIVALGLGIMVGALLLKHVDDRVLQAVIGIAVMVFSITSLSTPELRIPAGAERPLGAVAGAVGGVLGGMSSLFGPPILMFLVSLHIPKDEFVAIIGTVYLLGGVFLLAALAGVRVMGPEEVALSALATPPLLAGMALGQWLRDKISQKAFRTGLLVTVMLIGTSLLLRAVL
ncbi:MAG TPA: sulfite exporter TauE/SafE family protein [Gammaproteobacteria bacterium]|nr:sulfite exporter TauE/SafE family protein [Gammaproteobacteria bacterium]